MKTKKPKTPRRARFTGALANPIVRNNIEAALMVAILKGKDPAEVFETERARIDNEIDQKFALLVKHYNIDISPESGDVLPRLAIALCFHLVPGFEIVEHSAKKGRGRPAVDWTPFYRFVKDRQTEGRTITEACGLYRASSGDGKKPTLATLENRFHKCEVEEKEKSARMTKQLVDALMRARQREPSGMTRLRDPGKDDT